MKDNEHTFAKHIILDFAEKHARYRLWLDSQRISCDSDRLHSLMYFNNTLHFPRTTQRETRIDNNSVRQNYDHSGKGSLAWTTRMR